jgi:hypothetical protein
MPALPAKRPRAIKSRRSVKAGANLAGLQELPFSASEEGSITKVEAMKRPHDLLLGLTIKQSVMSNDWMMPSLHIRICAFFFAEVLCIVPGPVLV